MCNGFCTALSRARRLPPGLFCLFLLLTIATGTTHGQTSARESLLRLRDIFEQQQTLLAEQSNRITILESKIENSQTELESSRETWRLQIRDLQTILQEQETTLEQQGRSLESSRDSQKRAGESWTNYLATTERQIHNLIQEREREARRGRLRLIGGSTAGIVIGAGVAILILR